MNTRWSVWLLLFALALSGCVTKSKAAAQARAAYLAGQQEAVARLQQQSQQPSQLQRQPGQLLNVTIYGDVKNPIVPWTPGLTLAGAILAAGYSDSAAPTAIHIVRNGVAMAVDPKALATGADVPVQPGDLVQIK
jgi:hypothetical protein